ncbi:hypothetical protein ACA910_020593 [Epithemia clementina (nom. ined.)]
MSPLYGQSFRLLVVMATLLRFPSFAAYGFVPKTNHLAQQRQHIRQESRVKPNVPNHQPRYAGISNESLDSSPRPTRVGLWRRPSQLQNIEQPGLPVLTGVGLVRSIRAWLQRIERVVMPFQSLRMARRILVCTLLIFLVNNCFLATRSADATATSSMGLLSQTADITQLQVPPPKAPAILIQPSQEIMTEKIVQKVTTTPTLREGPGKVAKILTTSGAVLLATAGGMMLGSCLVEEEDDTETSLEKEKLDAIFTGTTNKKSLNRKERDSTSGDFARIRYDFDRIQRLEEEQESRLQLAQSLLSEISSTVDNSTQALKASAEIIKEATKKEPTFFELLMADSSSTEKTDDREQEEEQQPDEMEASPLSMEKFLNDLNQAEKTATVWKQDRDDFLQDLESTKNRVDQNDNLRAILPPPVQETEFAEWLHAMKQEDEYKWNDEEEEAQKKKRKEAIRAAKKLYFANYRR